MTLSELVKATQESLKTIGLELSQPATRDVIEAVFKTVADNVDETGVTVPNFGSFKVKERAARTCRNPRTGEQMQVPAKKVVAFKSKLVK